MNEPCLWCTTPPEQITEERLRDFKRKYKVNIEFEFIHCAAHKQLLHDLLGPYQPHWSCCKEPTEAETTAASQHSQGS